MSDDLRYPQTDEVRVGATLAETFRQYGGHIRYWMLAAVCILVPYLVLLGIFDYHAVSQWSDLVQSLLRDHSLQDLLNSQVLASNQSSTADNPTLASVLGLIRALVVMPLLFGIILRLTVSLTETGREPTLDEAFSASVRRLFAAAVTTLLWWFFWVLALSLLVFCTGLLSALALSMAGGRVLGMIVAGVFALAAVVVGIWLAVRFSQVSPVVFGEKRMLWDAIRRSWQLTRGQAWRVFAFFLITYVLISIVQTAVAALVASLVHQSVVILVVNGLVLLFTSPFSMLAQANLYVRLRARS
jgi:hypothetical protein